MSEFSGSPSHTGLPASNIILVEDDGRPEVHGNHGIHPQQALASTSIELMRPDERIELAGAADAGEGAVLAARAAEERASQELEAARANVEVVRERGEAAITTMLEFTQLSLSGVAATPAPSEEPAHVTSMRREVDERVQAAQKRVRECERALEDAKYQVIVAGYAPFVERVRALPPDALQSEADVADVMPTGANDVGALIVQVMLAVMRVPAGDEARDAVRAAAAPPDRTAPAPPSQAPDSVVGFSGTMPARTWPPHCG